jgi:hypothetical protein
VVEPGTWKKALTVLGFSSPGSSICQENVLVRACRAAFENSLLGIQSVDYKCLPCLTPLCHHECGTQA